MRFVKIRKSFVTFAASAGVWPAFKMASERLWVFALLDGEPANAAWVETFVQNDQEAVFVPQPRGLIFGGKRADSHLFLAIKDKNGRAVIKAGCRSFSFEDGYRHWGESREDRNYTSWKTGKMTNIDAWSRRCLQRMEKEARRRRWKI